MTNEERNDLLRYQALAIVRAIDAGEHPSIITNKVSKLAKLAGVS